MNKCPCCGKRSFGGAFYDGVGCPVCSWIRDRQAEDFPELYSSVNECTLEEARRNAKIRRGMENSLRKDIRKPCKTKSNVVLTGRQHYIIAVTEIICLICAILSEKYVIKVDTGVCFIVLFIILKLASASVNFRAGKNDMPEVSQKAQTVTRFLYKLAVTIMFLSLICVVLLFFSFIGIFEVLLCWNRATSPYNPLKCLDFFGRHIFAFFLPAAEMWIYRLKKRRKD